MASITETPQYRLAGLLRALEDPTGNRQSFEARLGATLETHEGLAPEDGGAPQWMYSRAIAMPSKALCRALNSGTAATAGDLAVAGIERVAEAIRPVDALMAAGVPRFEVTARAAVSFPSWVAESVAGSWQLEGANGYNPALTVRSVDATPHQAIAWLEISRRLRVQVPDVEGAILAELTRSTRSVLESGFLDGSGCEGKPHGLLRVPGRQTQAWAGASPTYSELVAMLEKYAAQHGNLSRARWIMGSALAADLLTTEKASATGQFVLEHNNNGTSGYSLLGIPVIVSDYMPAGKALLFDPTSCREVFWGPAYSLLDRFSDNRDLNGGSLLVVHQMCDIVSLAPAQIVVGG